VWPRGGLAYVAIQIAPGSGHAFDGLLQEFALRCIEGRSAAALVEIADDDAVGERLFRNVLTVMMLVGLPAGFRLALVAANARAEARYQTTQRDLLAAGMNVRLFKSEDDAVHWLAPQPAPLAD
jgi:hypothetical protein